jgi:hypothetical protein
MAPQSGIRVPRQGRAEQVSTNLTNGTNAVTSAAREGVRVERGGLARPAFTTKLTKLTKKKAKMECASREAPNSILVSFVFLCDLCG